MAALVSVSQVMDIYTLFTHLYANTSQFDNATDRLPWTDAARVRAASKPSNDQNGGFEGVY
jgi:hypothetical protein